MTVTELPIKPVAATFSYNSQRDVINGITSALAAASTDEVRNVLTYVRIDFNSEAGTVTFTATDSYRAHKVELFTSIIERSAIIMVKAKQLKASLPKLSEFPKSGGPNLELLFHPGRAELDAGQFGMRWGTSSFVMDATPDGGSLNYPNIDREFANAATDFHHKGTADEPVGFNPAYVADIAAAGKRIDKDKPMAYTPGSTPLKPSTWELKVPGLKFTALLMPVRLNEVY